MWYTWKENIVNIPNQCVAIVYRYGEVITCQQTGKEVQIFILFSLCPRFPFVWLKRKRHGAQDRGKQKWKGYLAHSSVCCAGSVSPQTWGSGVVQLAKTQMNGKNKKVNTARKTNGTRRQGCGDDGPHIPVMEKFSPQYQTKVFTWQTKGNITGGNKGTVKSFLPVPGE